MPLIPILTTIIGVVAKGKAAKAIAGGLSGAVLTAGGPIVDAFATGFSTGALPKIEEVGVMVGQLVGGWIVGYAVTWLAPANKPA